MRRHDSGADVFKLSIHKNNATGRGMAVLLIVLVIVGSANPTNAIGAPVAQSVEETTSEDPLAILAAARKIFVRSRTVYLEPEAIESALLEKSEFEQLELVIAKNINEADLIIEVDRAILAEVDRAIFTLEFPFKVIVPGTKLVAASGQVSSIGGTVEGEIASSLIKQIKVARGILPYHEK